MNKCFIFRDYTDSTFYPLLVSIDRNTGEICVNADDIEDILPLSGEDILKLMVDFNRHIYVDALLRVLKSKPELRNHPFRDWFEFQILPRIIDEFNNFTPNDALYEIHDLLEEIKDLINEQR
ncbi:MAG: hypothetical protein IJ667_05515 [Synergistaceae bacterium]|nr:hypothetical protein [Synergistaceae bacterium]